MSKKRCKICHLIKNVDGFSENKAVCNECLLTASTERRRKLKRNSLQETKNETRIGTQKVENERLNLIKRIKELSEGITCSSDSGIELYKFQLHTPQDLASYYSLMSLQEILDRLENPLEKASNDKVLKTKELKSGTIFNGETEAVLRINHKAESSSQYTETSIESFFSESHFISFRAFCASKGIQTVDQLNTDHFTEYQQRPQVGPKKVKAVMEKVELFNSLQVQNKERTLSQSHNGQIQHNIHEVFPEEKYATFRTFCEKNKLKIVEDLTEKHIAEYGLVKGVGAGKVSAVMKRIEQFTLSNRNIIHSNTVKASIIKDVFKGSIFAAFRNYCEIHQIRLVTEIKHSHIEDFSSMKGIGNSKIRAVKRKLADWNKENRGKRSNQKIIRNAGSLEINSLFLENKFNLFRDFCLKKRIKTISQIQSYHIAEFSQVKMVGKSKVVEVLKVLESYDYVPKAQKPSPVFFSSGTLYDVIKDKSMTLLLNSYEFNTQTASMLKVRDIEGKDIFEFNQRFESESLIHLAKKLQSQQLPKEIILGVQDVLTDRQYSVIRCRFEDKQTLEEIGIEFNLSRERVRQILKSALEKCFSYLHKQNFIPITRVLVSPSILVHRVDFLELIGLENRLWIEVFKQNSSLILFSEEFDAFHLYKTKSTNLEKARAYIKNLPDTLDLHKYRQALTEIKENFFKRGYSDELIGNLVEHEGYVSYGEVYSQRPLSTSEVLEYLFEHHISKPFLLDDKGINVLKRLAKQHIHYELEATKRAIDARIREIQNILLVDKSTFQYFDSKQFDVSIISEIEGYLNTAFKQKSIVSIEEILSEFLNPLTKIGVTNKYHLYSLVQYFLEEKFSIGKGNTLNIYRNEKSKLSVEDRIVLHIRVNSSEGTCSKDELLFITSPRNKIDIAVLGSSQLTSWGENQVILTEKLSIRRIEREKLLRYLTHAFRSGWTTSHLLFKEMKMDRRLFAILQEKGIDEALKLVSFVKLLLPEVKGHTNFLYLESSPINSFEKVIEETFKGTVSKIALRKFIKKHGYKERTITSLMKNLLEQNRFTEIDSDRLINTGGASMIKTDQLK